jgi:CRP-like cAMP-binding protein
MNLSSEFALVHGISAQNRSLSPLSWEMLAPLLRLKRLEKGDFVVKEGQYYDHEVFVLSGIIRGYYAAYDGQEANVIFLVGPDTAAHWASRTVDGKSIISYQALKPTVIAEVDNKKFEALIQQFPDIREFAFGVVFKGLQYKTLRERQLLTTSAEARYLAFRDLYPTLEAEIPHYHIASYLGITPVQLSRIRGKHGFR